MTTRYQKQHYEEQAKLLRDYVTSGGCGADEPKDPKGSRIINSFADLFAADNPPYCGCCQAEHPREGEVCTAAEYGTPGDHNFLGFDRAQFLAACGLESEG